MAVLKYLDPDTGEWASVLGGSADSYSKEEIDKKIDELRTSVSADSYSKEEIDKKIDELRTSVSEGTQIATGTYVGTDSTSKTLTFDEAPVMVMIIGSGSRQRLDDSIVYTYYYEDFAVLHSGGGLYYGKEDDNYTKLSPISVTSFNTTVTFTGKAGGYISHNASLNSQTGSTDAGAVMNSSYCTYRYIAFFA